MFKKIPLILSFLFITTSASAFSTNKNEIVSFCRGADLYLVQQNGMATFKETCAYKCVERTVYNASGKYVSAYCQPHYAFD